MYDGRLGRFLQPDPIGYAGGPNLYRYVDNDPSNLTDPLGLMGVGEEEVRDLQVHVPPWFVIPLDFLEMAFGRTHPGPVIQAPSAANTDAPEVEELPVAPCDIRCQQRAQKRRTNRFSNEYGAYFLAPVAAPVIWVLGLEVAGAAGIRLIATRLCNCFEEGTLVETRDGPRPIETLTVGTLVLSRDERTGEESYAPISQLIRGAERDIWAGQVRWTEGGATRTETIFVTDEHPWHSQGRWLKTTELARGTQLSRAGAAEAEVVFVTQTGRRAPTFNFEVAGTHTYFVGSADLWVHNANCLHMHHLLPRQFAARFRAAGLNIEKFRIPLAQGRHTGRGGIHSGPRGESWNGQWQKFFQENPNAGAQQILDHLGVMRQMFGI